MNKYFYIAGALVLIIASGVAYNMFFVADTERPVETGVVRNITITARTNRWEFDPEFIEVDQGDRIVLTVINQDKYDHGFAIDAFGVSQRMPANETIRIEFVATQAGDFPYYCSVSCGAGVVDGVERGHFDQIGKMHVRSIITETSSFAPTDTNPPQTNTPPATPEIPTAPAVPETPATAEPDTTEVLDEAFASALTMVAAGEARRLGYDTARLRAVHDTNNARWMAFHETIGGALGNDPVYAFLAGSGFNVVYFTASANPDAVYLWVFVDAESGQVLNSLEMF